jgi:hypothetical protein
MKETARETNTLVTFIERIHWWLDNIKLWFRGLGWDGMYSINLAHDRDMGTLVNTVVNLSVA